MGRGALFRQSTNRNRAMLLRKKKGTKGWKEGKASLCLTSPVNVQS